MFVSTVLHAPSGTAMFGNHRPAQPGQLHQVASYQTLAKKWPRHHAAGQASCCWLCTSARIQALYGIIEWPILDHSLFCNKTSHSQKSSINSFASFHSYQWQSFSEFSALHQVEYAASVVGSSKYHNDEWSNICLHLQVAMIIIVTLCLVC